MRLCSFHLDDGAATQVGIVTADDRVVLLSAAAVAAQLPDLAGRTTADLLAVDPGHLDRLAQSAALLDGDALDATRLGPPVPAPDKIVCLGLNYRDHAEEAGLPLPKAPILFPKFRDALIGHGATIIPPRGEHDIDYEAELAVVIGRGGRDIAAADALGHVGGYMPFNDVSARDLQNLTPQWTAGKAIDTFGPCGPYLTTADEVADPQALRLIARVNGLTLQDGNTADMIFAIAEQIEFISSLMTLHPGDIIATGTPAGVGFTRTPPVLLHEGDIVEIEVEGLGTLRNPIGAASPKQTRPAAVAEAR